MKKSQMSVFVGVVLFFISGYASELTATTTNVTAACSGETKKYLAMERFLACENNAGAGFFWVDSSCGEVWWASPADCTWVYYGKPAGAQKAEIGRYVPLKNKSGAGLFILDSISGEGWWTNGRRWEQMGVPKAQETNSLVVVRH